MRRTAPALAALAAVLAAAGAGFGAFQLADGHRAGHPQISVYSHGNLVRVGPYEYCDVLDLNDCQRPETLGVLAVTPRDPVQLAVPAAISRAPWVLHLAFEDGDLSAQFQPGTRLAVTIDTVDARRGRLTGIVVQLPTLARFPDGSEGMLPHAEWSVATVWS